MKVRIPVLLCREMGKTDCCHVRISAFSAAEFPGSGGEVNV